MKKILLACFIALGITSNAQYSYVGDFENPGYSTVIYKQFGGGSQLAAAACNGGFGGRLLPTASIASTGYMVDLSTIAQTGNGQKIDVSVNYKKLVGVAGTLQIAYFKFDSASNSWSINLVGSPVALANAAITTCATLSATVPSGAIQPTDIAGVGAWFVKSGTANAAIYLDDIVVNQDTSVTTAPACTTFTTPANGSAIDGGNYVFTWALAPTAVNYDVTIGSSPGASDVLNTTVNGNVNSLNVTLPVASTLYANVVPKNASGSATGCSEITFTTNSTINYCGPLTSSAPTAVAPIKSVNFAGITNSTDAAATTIGTFAPYQDFTTTKFSVASNTANVPLTLTGITNGAPANGWAMTVFIDWNNDGDFNDANEQYFNTTASMLRVTGVTDNPVTLKGNITIPAGVSVGEKRMRIKYNFSGTVIHDALSTGCSTMGNGQAEDYTLEITPALTTLPSCATVLTPVNAATTVTPNPLKLAWDFVNGASSFKIYIGTSPGGVDIVNGAVVTKNSYEAPVPANTNLYVRVVPSNSTGDAAGCTEISFTTGNLLYCTAGATSTTATFEKISNVNFATINNPSTSAAGYEDFTSVVGTVNRENTYTVTVDISNFDGDATMVWIDYNQDGIFDETTEKTTLSVAASATGSILIPADAKLGNTRMRVRMHYATSGGNATSCGTSTFGQVEDYTINILEKIPTATSSVDKNKVSVYPNPFHDVLNISDSKGVKSVSISDVAGRQVKTMKASTTLNLSDLKTGLYIVTLHMEDGSVKSIKAIKK